jgi:hypothetical protein
MPYTCAKEEEEEEEEELLPLIKGSILHMARGSATSPSSTSAR